MNPGARLCLLGAVLVSTTIALAAAAPFEISGIYPHLATFNRESECGTGAVVPWADRLWVISYAPHKPRGSSDKLYEITPDLRQIIRPESVGGTPANRMIHRESQQLFIGPYIIDAQRNVRVIPPDRMYGRLTGNARHLTDPTNKIYYATMEEGFYEVDVHTLAVTELFRDEQLKEPFRRADIPGYHGKGFYSGQGRVVYANNGENSPLARQKPDIPSGALTEWDGRSDTWHTIRRNQFCEVTGPGGIFGNEHPATDPIWSIGWDHRSLILMVLDAGQWHSYRLPKASHAYDGAHGWNTEWPRIRDIGERDLLMTMHGAFWRFPKDFAPAKSSGIAPRSNYLKVVADFARWGDRVVLGCDDTAMSEFLNQRRAKGKLAGPGQSQSNLWFVEPARLDELGPAIGRGAVWLDEAVRKDEPSDAYLFSGFEHRTLHLMHDGAESVTFTLEVDRAGDGRWTELRQVDVPAGARPPPVAQGESATADHLNRLQAVSYNWVAFKPEETGAWVRVRASRDCAKTTAFFSMRNGDRRGAPDARFDGLLREGAEAGSGGLLRARGEEKKTLGFAATAFNRSGAEPAAFYEMGPEMKLRRTDERGATAWMQANVAIPRDAVVLDAASVIYTNEQGKRFRLPKARSDYPGTGPLGAERTIREVCTERDLLNCAGTFFEVPAENAGGIAKLRPIATHNRRVHDFATCRGMLIISGVAADAPAMNRHIIRSEDGKVAVWAGVVDDLWSFGKPVGQGGPWKDARISAGQPSDPYLMTGYDRKTLTLSHRADRSVRMKVEVDIAGTGAWAEYGSFDVAPGRALTHAFPDGYQAYWLRVSASHDTTATAWLVYE